MKFSHLPVDHRTLLQHTFLNWLYAPTRESLHKMLFDICKLQVKVTRNLNYGFRHKGELHTIGEALPEFKYARLDKSLVPEAEQYLQKRLDYVKERHLVKNCVTNALIRCKDTRDVGHYLPKQLLQAAANASYYLDNNYEPSEPEKLTAFLTDWDEAIQLIKERLVMRTLEI